MIWNHTPAPKDRPFLARRAGTNHVPTYHADNWLVAEIHGHDYEWSEVELPKLPRPRLCRDCVHLIEGTYCGHWRGEPDPVTGEHNGPMIYARIERITKQHVPGSNSPYPCGPEALHWSPRPEPIVLPIKPPERPAWRTWLGLY